MACIVLLGASLSLGVNQEVKPGEIIDKVVCLSYSEQSYALYLPSNYTRERSWPILYAFDPGARGRVPVERFQDAAERYGFIVAGSNNSHNGPWEPIFKAASAMGQDTFARLSIDQKRIYVTGFSGGARVASIFPQMFQLPIAGIIGCGAGIASAQKPEDLSSSLYCGIIGHEDFSFREMMTLSDQLEALGIFHRLIVFDGGHNWPPSGVCMRAMEWMEVMAMKKKARRLDQSLVDETFSKEMDTAKKLEEVQEPVRAASLYETISQTYCSLRDVQEAEDRLKQLKESKVYQEHQKEESKVLEREKAYVDQLAPILAQIEQGGLSLLDKNQIIRDLRISHLLKKSRQDKNPHERRMAVRILEGMWVNCRISGWSFLEKGDADRAILFLEIAMMTGIHRGSYQKYLYFGLASAHALGNNKKKALENLEAAVQHGLSDTGLLEEEKNLDGIRNLPEFQKIKESMQKD